MGTCHLTFRIVVRLLLGGILGVAPPLLAQPPTRPLPRPLPGHPGNVFLAHEEVVLPLPASLRTGWQLVDYDARAVREGTGSEGELRLGRLPVGFYRLRPRPVGEGDWTSLAVLTPLAAPTPLTSPIGLDVACAWFYPTGQMAAAANLCALAGVNWVRDRLSWAEMEPERGRWADANRYDASARIQRAAGLQVLQVHHASPSWANPNRKRFPLDLRDAWRFQREMARRWTGLVHAFEPWNEADIPVFGGHTGSEMASLQKAAWLGLKAGNPDAIAGLNVFATHRRAHLEDLEANETWPYFDTFNLHHYEPFENYPGLYAAFRSVAAGRPLWVTECALPVQWTGDPQRQEPSEADLRVQAERVAKTYALALHEGAAVVFYFLLPHYVEGQTQFGLVRRDLTPRPAYVALAAVGRLLADARPLGRLLASRTQRAALFAARPDGVSRLVLVAWDTAGESKLALPAAPLAQFDLLGRPLLDADADAGGTLRLSPAPVFAVFPADTLQRFALTPPPFAPTPRIGHPSPIVLQAHWPEERVRLEQSAYGLRRAETERIPVCVYNFGAREATGRLRVNVPAGWSVHLPPRLTVPPGGRVELLLTVNAPSDAGLTRVRVQGDFGRAGRPVLSLRLLPEDARSQ